MRYCRPKKRKGGLKLQEAGSCGKEAAAVHVLVWQCQHMAVLLESVDAKLITIVYAHTCNTLVRRFFGTVVGCADSWCVTV